MSKIKLRPAEIHIIIELLRNSLEKVEEWSIKRKKIPMQTKKETIINLNWWLDVLDKTLLS